MIIRPKSLFVYVTDKVHFVFSKNFHTSITKASSNKEFSKWLFRCLVIGFSFASLLLRFAIPPVLNLGATHDDELLVRLAFQIKNGNWLGEYANLGHLTLAKPAGFPLFLALTSHLPWSQVISVHLILILAIVSFVRELHFFGMSRRFSLISLVFLLFFPLWYQNSMSRIYREGLLTALTFLLISVTLSARRKIAIFDSSESKTVRSFQVLIFFIAGLIFGFLMIVKNFWQPAFVMFVLITAPGIFVAFRLTRRFKALLIRAFTVFIPIAIGVSIPVIAVSAMNKSHYGVFTLESFSSGQFPRTISLLSSIEPSDTRPYVQVTADQRARAYEISPTFTQLKPTLEQPNAAGWRGSACSTIGLCDESGAWFPWELRDAAQTAGLADNATEFESTFRMISNDIERACQTKLIVCGARGLAPGLRDPFDIPLKYIIDAEAMSISNLIQWPTGGEGIRGVVDPSHPMYKEWKSVVPAIEPWSGPSVYQPNNYGLGDVQGLLINLYQSIWVLLVISAMFGILIPKNSLTNPLASTLRILGFAGLASTFLGTFLLALLEASSGAYLTFGGSLYVLPLFPFMFLFLISGMIRLRFFVNNFFAYRSLQ
jgi:hypothetical protein